MATGMPPMGGMPPQGPPQGGNALGMLGKKPSTPDSGAPLLQMIMSLLAGAGLKDFSSSLSNLVKTLGGGPQTHHKASGMPPGQQPSKPGMPPAGPPGAPPAISGAQPPPGAPPPGGAPQGGAGGLPPELLQKLLAMLAGQGGPPQQ